jgi:hypothetical protein
VTEDEIFETWAPRGGRWSPWVKPVLFSFVDSVLTNQEIPLFTGLDDVSPVAETAIVVDLPGVESIAAALVLAARGWRPVPLFNALPGPGEDFVGPTRPPVAVDVHPIIMALRMATPVLDSSSLSPLAPPAFLLDSRRHAPGWKTQFGTFDNRSMTFPTDFPSAAKLREYSISHVLVIQQSAKLQDDLTYTLRQWQESGLPIELLEPGPHAQRRPCAIRKVTTLGLWWMRVVTFLTFRRDRRGSFGGMLVEPSSS